MSAYEPGTVAAITIARREDGSDPQKFERCIYDGENNRWVSGTHGAVYADEHDASHWQVTEVRPLVVLDLRAASPDGNPSIVVDNIVHALRNGGTNACRGVAAQIEAQTKPPRIPEPGLWGVVDTGRDGEFVNVGPGWLSVEHGGMVHQWGTLIDPVLVREGVES